ncbi:MAG: transposase zinc-binding domain-containing protein [Myxococcales bacterium]|nr:transposase zinc-binding domain-containing protein [Myxococcales bacterium]
MLLGTAPSSSTTPVAWRPATLVYEPRCAEATVLHRALSRHLGRFLEQARTDDGQGVPLFVERELRRFLACGDLRRGFARVHCDDCHKDRLVPT